MLHSKISLILIIIFEVFSANKHKVLFKTGWYKTRRRGEKESFSRIQSINPDNAPNTTYLKVSAVIPVLPHGAIEDLEYLEDLTLSSCGIRDIQPGAFQNLPKLSRINLKENGVEHVKKGVFNSLQITVLFLNKNEIKTIDSDAFDNMSKLTKIKLNSNKISAWDSDWFKNTPLLSLVSVRRNFIKEIPANAFKHFAKRGVSKDERKVPDVKIFLSKNQISLIDPRAFGGLKKLGQIWLDRNKLTQLNGTIFGDMTQIHVLNVAKNNLTEIPRDLFENMQNVRLLDITANHKIKCVPVEVVRIVKQLQVSNNRGFNCSCVTELTEKAKEFNHELITDAAGC